MQGHLELSVVNENGDGHHDTRKQATLWHSSIV